MKKIEKNQPIRIAFLGCGFATHLHSKTLSGIKDVQRYYASRSLQKAKKYQKKYKGSGAFGSYDEAIASKDVDVIFIATPPANHLELTEQAMKSGKHVIVEKPPYLHASDFDTIKKWREETGCQVMVAENYFYKPSLVRLRQILAEGLIGDPLFIHLNATKTQKTGNWRDDMDLSGGGALFEGGIHWVNFMANMGLTIESVQGFQPAQKKNADLSMQIVARFKEGAIGSLLYSWEVSTIFFGLRISRIFGREGSITFESNGIFMFVRGKKKRLIFPSLKHIAGYRPMLEDFLQALRNGEEPAFTLDLAQRDLQIIEEVYASIKK